MLKAGAVCYALHALVFDNPATVKCVAQPPTKVSDEHRR